MKHASAFILACMAFALQAEAQHPYDVTLNMATPASKLYLVNYETNTAVDSASVTNGSVHFVGASDLFSEEVSIAAICEEPSVRTAVTKAFFIDDTPLTLTYAIGNNQVEGSALNQKHCEYTEIMMEAERNIEAIMEEYKELVGAANNDPQQIDKEKMHALQERYQTIAQQHQEAEQKAVAENKDNLIPLPYLIYGGDQLGLDFVETYLTDYAYADRASLAGVKKQIEANKVKAPGAKVVDFVMNNLEGKPVHLTDYVGKGNYVLVDFWASWCGPCRAEMPTVKACYEKYHASKGFEVVGVSFDAKEEAWKKGVEQLGITWPQMSDLKYWQSEAAALYNIRAIPSTLLYSPEGTVVQADLRGEQLVEKLKEIYGE